ncbi:hypothetical protein QJS04_geneDACA006174 [Acorus gramineus]|uniref:Protein yippee-like n=1 Tax=Acorus gramineus TaxID=55184 RepID=A0AAV9B535_ACOGR|nr:hypothetical protein QJS04_geneDACA006174 [Acorus gramineus]
MSQTDVTYSCGACKYPLNLTSSNRVTTGLGSDYRRSIKKGVISFVSIDLSRFTQVDEINCLPVLCGRNRSKTKLLCRNCSTLIGYGRSDSITTLCGIVNSSSSSDSTPDVYMIKIRALQPSEQPN